MDRRRVALVLLAIGGAATFAPAVTAAVALAAGVLLALALGNPYAKRTGRVAGTLLRASVIGLGFGISFATLTHAAAEGLSYVVAAVVVALGAGLLLGRLLRVDREAALLIASGTSICGGSAIAAVGSTIRARSETMGAALGIVFLLNAIALYAFPPIGRALGLSETQFAIWAATAIHDTSSVVAAAGLYGPRALEQATVLKLVRTLFLIPLVIGIAWLGRRHAVKGGEQVSVGVPWFPLLFLLAVVARSFTPADLWPVLDQVARAARRAVPLVLFLIGASITTASLRALGLRPFVHAAALWAGMAAALLLAVVTLAG